jgi:hypothetical protein
MPVEARCIPEDRPLTPHEATLVRWLLEHGLPGVDAASFLPQLDQARVVSRCPCGCASVDFAISDRTPPAGAPLRVLSDCEWDGESGAKLGVFVFAKENVLAGLEVWSIDGFETPAQLPRIEQLKPIAWTKKA